MHPPVVIGGAVLLGVALSPALPAPPVLAGLIVCALAARLHRGLLVPAALLLGALVAVGLPEGPALTGPVVVQGTVAAAPTGRQADLDVWACAVRAGPFAPCGGRVRVVFDTPPSPGSSWVVSGRAGPPDADGLGGPQPALGMERARIRTLIRASRARRIGGDLPDTPVAEGPLGLLAAVARGDRRGVDADSWRILRDTGTAHLLAISGFHVGVVAGAVGLVALALGRRVGVLVPSGVHPAMAWWAGALAAVAYAWSAGAPISAQRAAGMVVLAAVGRSLGRTLDPWRFLVAVGVLVLAVDPGALVAPGFQLSFGAVVGLLRFGGPLQRALAPLGWAGRGLAASTAATLGTLPAAAWWFQSLAPTSPVANLLAIPWMAFGIAPFAAVWAWGPEPLAGWAGWAGGMSVSAFLVVLDRLATAPLTPAVDASGALFLGAIFLRARADWVLAVLLLGLGLGSRPVEGLEVTFLDVGQGAAALVEHADGRVWLVDGGRSPRVLEALRRRGIRRLDRVVASHGDADHAGGLPAVLCGVRVEALLVGREEGHDALLEAASRCGVPVHVRGTTGPSANAASLVTRVESPWGSVLLAGDVEGDAEDALGPADVLAVPHHGSRTSSGEAMLDRVQPVLAVLSVGPNRYGHPHAEVLHRYDQRGIPVARTDVDGSVRVRLDARGIRYGATGPFTWFSLDRRASPKNTTIANTARPRLIPWL